MSKERKCNASAKWCWKCEQCLPYTNFYKDKSRFDGLENKCKKCSRGSKLARAQAQKRESKRQSAQRVKLVTFKEIEYREYWAKQLPNSRQEVSCANGLIDIVTKDMVIELKEAKNYKSAIGQVLCYQLDYPNKQPAIILLPSAFPPDRYTVESACSKLGIIVMWESYLYRCPNTGRIERKGVKPTWIEVKRFT